MRGNNYQCFNKNYLKASKEPHWEEGGQTPRNFLETIKVNNDEDLNLGAGKGLGEDREDTK